MVYEALSLKGKMVTFFALTTIIEIILESKDKNNEFDMPDQKPCSIQFNRFVKAFRLRPNLKFSRHFKC